MGHRPCPRMGHKSREINPRTNTEAVSRTEYHTVAEESHVGHYEISEELTWYECSVRPTSSSPFYFMVYQNPEVRPSHGRHQSKRIKSGLEKGQTKMRKQARCGLCKQTGHNRQTCNRQTVCLNKPQRACFLFFVPSPDPT